MQTGFVAVLRAAVRSSFMAAQFPELSRLDFVNVHVGRVADGLRVGGEDDGAAADLHRAGLCGDEREVVVANQVAQAIIDFARTHDVELIAMPTHGRGASRLLVGSVADKVIRASGGPVLLQRPVGVQSGPGLQPPLRPAVQLPALALA